MELDVLCVALLIEQILCVKIPLILLFKKLELKGVLEFISFLAGLLKKIDKAYFPLIIVSRLADINVRKFLIKFSILYFKIF